MKETNTTRQKKIVKLYTARELAEALGVCEKSIRTWGEQDGPIKKLQLGGKGCSVRYFITLPLDVASVELRTWQMDMESQE